MARTSNTQPVPAPPRTGRRRHNPRPTLQVDDQAEIGAFAPDLTESDEEVSSGAVYCLPRLTGRGVGA